MDDIKAESTVDEDEETADVKEETAPFGRKFLVFESNLFELFQNCYKCLAPSEPRIEKSVGSMIVIVSKCKNGHIRSWTSQQCDGQMPWGNMLCAAGTLFTGSNPARIDSFFKHLGIQYMSLRTYYKIQKFYLAPAVNRCWENEQSSLLKSLQGKSIAVGGDARCDSPGHSAKYGTYHLVELNLNKVLAVELVQVIQIEANVNVHIQHRMKNKPEDKNCPIMFIINDKKN